MTQRSLRVDELGYNFRMTDVHAAIGLEQLKKLAGFNQRRQANAQFLSQHLEGVVVPQIPDGCEHVFNQYTVRVPDGRRDGLIEHLRVNGVGCGVYYPVPVHQQSFYMEQLGYSQHLPEAEGAAAEVLSLPVHPALSSADLESIVAAVNQFMSDQG
jgi:perosamine synthetase